MNKILVTGGTAYIGSHACVALIDAGYHHIVLDNLTKSSVEVVNRIEWITGSRPAFIEVTCWTPPCSMSVLLNTRPPP